MLSAILGVLKDLIIIHVQINFFPSCLKPGEYYLVLNGTYTACLRTLKSSEELLDSN